jgi:hypothetical protein
MSAKTNTQVTNVHYPNKQTKYQHPINNQLINGYKKHIYDSIKLTACVFLSSFDQRIFN